MLEIEKGKNRNEVPTRSLLDVAQVDYFAITKIIRQQYVVGFDSHQYDSDIKEAYAWLTDGHTSISLLSEIGIPDCVKKNRFTIGLFMELRNEVRGGDPTFTEPVGFDLSSKSLREDIENFKKVGFKGNEGYKLMDPDMLSFVIFSKYWHVLRSRAKLLQEKK